MYDCQSILKLLYPYLDSELDVKESLRVQEHLESCPFCLPVFKHEQQFLAFFKKTVSTPPAPIDLQRKISRIMKDAPLVGIRKGLPVRPLFSKAIAATSAVAMVVILIMAGSLFLDSVSNHRGDKNPPKGTVVHMELMKAAVENHKALTSGGKSFEVVENDPGAILHHLHQGLNVKIALPLEDLSHMEPIGGNLLRVGSRKAGIITFQSPEGMVSLFMTDPQDLMKIKKDGIPFKSLTFFPAEYRGYHTLAWNVPGKVVYIIVSDQKRKLIEACQICHGNDRKYDFGWARHRI